jgi:hypothetical protein
LRPDHFSPDARARARSAAKNEQPLTMTSDDNVTCEIGFSSTSRMERSVKILYGSETGNAQFFSEHKFGKNADHTIFEPNAFWWMTTRQ